MVAAMLAVDGFACGIYGLAPREVARACRAALRPVPSVWDGLFQCFVRLGNGVPRRRRRRRRSDLRAIVRAVADAGCNGINFYNRCRSASEDARLAPRRSARDNLSAFTYRTGVQLACGGTNRDGRRSS